MTTRGELVLYHSGIPNRLSCAVRGWKVCVQRILTTLPPDTQLHISALSNAPNRTCDAMHFTLVKNNTMVEIYDAAMTD